jgi:DeoR family myo-inositol catabolism operon transcriptional repressor
MRTKRIQKIKEYILKNGQASLDELCSEFDVSINTIRRDISELEGMGILHKVYGGVEADTTVNLVPFEKRTIKNQDSKKKIAHAAASFIEENDIIFIDSGTTTLALLDTLDINIHLVIFTNSLDIINSASNFLNINLFLVGRNYKHSTRSFVDIEKAFLENQYNINKAFMSATGVSIEKGLTNSDPRENDIKSLFVKKASKIYLLADNTKYNKYKLLSFSQLKDVDTIITDRALPPEYEEYCRKNHVNVMLVTNNE